MGYRDSVDLSDPHTQRVSGGGGGGRVALSGGIGGLVLMLLVASVGPCLGINASGLFGSGSGQDIRPAVRGNGPEHCKQKGVNVNTNHERRWLPYKKVIQGYWSKTMPNYECATVKLFSSTVSIACGVGQTEMGPFYCSGNSTVYIGDSYIGQLLKQLDASGGNAAKPYIVTHEFGHHIQGLDGAMCKVRHGTGTDSSQVRLELRTDCYVGAVFNRAMKDSNSLIKAVSKGDLLRTAGVARSIGGDHIQK